LVRTPGFQDVKELLGDFPHGFIVDPLTYGAVGEKLNR
jgi:hypothetical protein